MAEDEVTIIVLIDNKVLAIKTSKAKIANLLANQAKFETKPVSANDVLGISVLDGIGTSDKLSN